MVVLNVAANFSLEYERQKLSVSMNNIMKYKSDIIIKLEKERNTSGSGFIDTLSCPKNITLSWATNTSTVDTSLMYEEGVFVCRGTYGWNTLDIFFNSWSTDIALAKYDTLHEVPLNSTQITGIFDDVDTTFIDLWNTAYTTTPDSIDDNFDSDNYKRNSTGAIDYPDGYTDDDADARIITYGYILPNSGLYNIFWSNDIMMNYIAENTNNTGWDVIPLHGKGRLILDSDKDFRIVIYEIDKARYNDTTETVISSSFFGTGQLASLGYIQDNADLSLSLSGSTTAYEFDFATTDYAIFLENTSTGSLLYQLRGETLTGTPMYITPLKDDDPSLISYFSSHVFVDATGRLIADMREFFALK